MEFHSTLIVLLSMVALCACDGNSRTLVSSGSYTDTLLNGIRRLENQARRKVPSFGSVVSNNLLDECYPICPIGTVCVTDIGVRKCVAAPIVGTASVGASYHDPLISSSPINSDYGRPAVAVVGSGYSEPVEASVGLGASYRDPSVSLSGDFNSGVVLSGATNLGGVGVGVSAGLGYGDNFVRFSGCGIVPPECRANQVNPGFLSGVYKYTFDYTLNSCVQISVCSSCALISGAQNNLFNTLFACNRYCRQ